MIYPAMCIDSDNVTYFGNILAINQKPIEQDNDVLSALMAQTQKDIRAYFDNTIKETPACLCYDILELFEYEVNYAFEKWKEKYKPLF